MYKYNLEIQKHYSPEAMERFEKLLEAENSHLNQRMVDNGDCKFWSESFTKDFTDRFARCSLKYGQAIFVLGGSHGMDLYNAMALNTSSKFVVSVSKGACRAHKPVGYAPTDLRCQYSDFKKFAKENNKHISHVFYTQTPDRLFRQINLSKALESDLSIAQLIEVAEYLKEISTVGSFKVIMVGMLPPIKRKPLEWNYKQPFEISLKKIYSEQAIKLSRLVDSKFQAQFDDSNVRFVSKIDAFSISYPKDLVINGEVTYSDSRHLSFYGEREFGERFIVYLNTIGYSEIRPNFYKLTYPER